MDLSPPNWTERPRGFPEPVLGKGMCRGWGEQDGPRLVLPSLFLLLVFSTGGDDCLCLFTPEAEPKVPFWLLLLLEH